MPPNWGGDIHRVNNAQHIGPSSEVRFRHDGALHGATAQDCDTTGAPKWSPTSLQEGGHELLTPVFSAPCALLARCETNAFKVEPCWAKGATTASPDSNGIHISSAGRNLCGCSMIAFKASVIRYQPCLARR